MFAKKFLLLVVSVFLLSNFCFAATIVVTSNADTGPGTLREALAIAAGNGTTAPDIIQFNLPGSLVSDRTIRLKSQLPSITSNITIDGTTQPGIAFGVSNAKVIIEPETSPVYFNALNINGEVNAGGAPATKIAIYGLYIRNFAKINSLATADLNQGSGLMMQGDVSGVIIGAPGKGNVFCGNINGIYNTSYYYAAGASDIQIQSNIIGLLDDGFTAASNYTGINLTLDKDGLIGGTDAGMGNVIAANVTGINIARAYYYGVANTITMQNNKIGTDYTGKVDFKNIPLLQQSAFIKAYGVNVNSSNTTVNITSNLISGQRYCGVYIENATFKITANKIGTDITGTKDLGNGEGIHAGTSSSGTIGGSAVADINYIGYNFYGIEALNSTHTLITHNSIFCNSDYGISVVSNNYQVPFVQVLNFSGTAVSGTATPNCKIELFLSDDCGNICQGKTYIATVTSNASGAWSYSGTFSKAVIATATDANNNTSPFSSLVIQDNDVVVKNYTCAYQGSVTIQQPRTGLLFHWDKKETNGSLTPIGDTQNIKNLLPGTYQLTIQYPGGCQKITQLFEIKDLRIKIQNVIVPTPQCRQKSFPFDVNFTGGTGNVTFAWKDKAGLVKSTDKAANLPEGTYTVTIYDEAGCAVTSSPAVTIKAKPGPDYDLSTMQVAPARCGIADGGISNITTTVGIGTLTYKWTNDAGVVVATTKNLAKVKGGYYTLTLYDQSECSPYSTPSIFIQETNSVNISGGAITPAKCGANNGAITGVYVQNADLYQWYDPQGNAMATNQNNLDIFNLADGTYRLNAVNTVTKCSNDGYFTVNRLTPEVFTIKSLTSVATTCGLNNGAINLEIEGKIIPVSYQWLKQDGTFIGSSPSISGLTSGFYTLNLTDKYGCPSVLVNNLEVKVTPLLQFSSLNNPVSNPDQCDQLFGSITGVDVTGGVPPYKYTWTNMDNNIVAGTDKELKNVGKGNYSLVVTDNTACAIPLTVGRAVDNNEFVPDQPVVNNQRICDPETVTISVQNPVTGTYKLYADATAMLPLLTNTTGRFSLAVTETSDFYISYSIGTCESNRIQTHIEIVHVDVKKPNSFTPNGDGVNDYWKIEGLEKFPGSVVQVFNRYGQKVFESKEYVTVFAGKFNDQLLPPGVYYYIINLNTPCSLLSGSLTIIR